MGHALQIATRGRYQGSTLGLVSSGYLIRITEIPIYEVPSKYKAAIPRDEKKKKKCKVIKIEIEYSGQTYETMHCVSKDTKISVEDVQIIEKNGKIVEIRIKDISI